MKNIIKTIRGKRVLKIYLPKGIYVNDIEGNKCTEEVLFALNDCLGLIDYSFYDEEIEAIIFECKLLDLR